ncbi:glycosyltransferase family 1 protein [Hymenobacter oligotrophus]|uniref:Glycosyltransferase family 1 protein n=1 Tax=Hymenobacter oligotrophus TaxID=2319843 RepID=A0A3B7R0B2_9BACT|nr:glycosyltransferase family 4 protein [Hymenobacter oligotrophus]AYA37192.1 glycosyltransferase family 1 protein [Hymenobacter oligotrophus]
MRILISTWSLQVGGGEVLAMNLASELARRGHELFVFNQRAELIDHDLVKRLLPPQVTVLSMQDRPRRSFWAYKVNAVQRRLGLAATFYEKQQQAYLAECLRRYQIDLVSSHATYSDRLCASVTTAAGIPLYITEHGEYTQFLLEGRRDFESTLKAARQIITVSDYCRNNLQQVFPSLPPVHTIYNGVVTNASHTRAGMRQHMGLPADAFVVGMVARGRADKGWQQAIDAFRMLRQQPQHRPLRLVLVGGSDYLKNLQQQYAGEADIIFTGRVPNPDFYVAGFDVGLLPTYFPAEALPLVIIEYMAFGVPTVATRVGGVPELLTSFETAGQLIELDLTLGQPRVEDLHAAVQRYYLDTQLYEKHSQNARRVGARLGMVTCANHYEQVFNQHKIQHA